MASGSVPIKKKPRSRGDQVRGFSIQLRREMRLSGQRPRQLQAYHPGGEGQLSRLAAKGTAGAAQLC